jgi:hypothetical protein
MAKTDDSSHSELREVLRKVDRGADVAIAYGIATAGTSLGASTPASAPLIAAAGLVKAGCAAAEFLLDLAGQPPQTVPPPSPAPADRS